MVRIAASILRGAFRLLLGACVALAGAYAVLALIEALFVDAAVGGTTGFTFVIDHGGWFVGLAVVVGAVLALACDRLWMRLRRLGPPVSSRP
jgi:hypothetical protein